MKRLLKVTLSALCVLSMTGCGSKRDDNISTDKNNTKVTEKKESKTGKSKYFDNFDKEVRLKSLLYNISVPNNTYSYNDTGCNMFEIEDVDENTINVIVLSRSIKESNISNFDIDSIDSNLSVGKTAAMSDMYSTTKYDLNVENSKILKLQKSEGMYKYGQLTIDEKPFNCVEFSFVLHEEDDEKDLCELIIVSDDYEEKDLKNIAEELISQIHETK